MDHASGCNAACTQVASQKGNQAGRVRSVAFVGFRTHLSSAP
jgi:hypothetical protein